MKKGIIEGKEARKYEQRVKDRERTKLKNKFILKNIRLNKKVRVADFCCGPGNTIEILKDRVGEIVGVDASKEMIKICQEKFGKDKKNIKLKLAWAENTSLKSNYFDYVVLRMGLHHVKEKEKVIEEVYRVLKPKGKLILIDRFYLNLFLHKLREISGLIFRFKTSIFNHFEISEEELKKLLSQRFRIIKKEFPPRYKWKTGQAFMLVLEKKS